MNFGGIKKFKITKTCRKFEQICRFFYPRFPSLKTIVSVPFYKLNLTKEEQEAKLESSKKVLKQVKEILEDEEIMDELIKIGSEEIEQYKQLQRGILFLEKLIKDLKRKKQRVTIITDECHKDLLRVCIDFEPEDWKFSCNRLTEILDSIKKISYRGYYTLRILSFVSTVFVNLLFYYKIW